MNSPSDKILPHPSMGNSADLLIWIIIALQLLLALGAYPFLPAQVPIHWSGGHANSYGPKWMATFLFPGSSLLVWFVQMRQIAGPHLFSRMHEAANLRWRRALFVGSILALLLVQMAATARNLGMNLDLSFLVNLGLGGIFIFFGNYMGKPRRNFWMGIRTPWTLVSDDSWERGPIFAAHFRHQLEHLAWSAPAFSPFYHPYSDWDVWPCTGCAADTPESYPLPR